MEAVTEPSGTCGSTESAVTELPVHGSGCVYAQSNMFTLSVYGVTVWGGGGGGGGD